MARLACLAVIAMLAVACGGDGPSQAEYDQKLAELALVQQQLVESRAEVSAATQLEALDDLASRYETLVLDALGLEGMITDPDRDRVEALAEAVFATAQERDMLLEVLEEAGEPGEVELPLFDAERVAGLLTIAATTQEFLRPAAPPDRATVVETLGSIVAEVDDEMVSLAYDDLLSSFDTDPDEAKREKLAALGYWGIEMTRSALAS